MRNQNLAMMTLGLMMPLSEDEIVQITGATQKVIADNRAEDQARIKDLETQLAEATSRQTAEGRRPELYGDRSSGDGDGGASVPRPTRMTKEERREHVIQRIGNAARGLAVAQRSSGAVNPVEFIEKTYNDRATAAALQRSLAVGDAAAGGNLVETQYAADLIELLYPTAVVRAMGARVVPMPNGNMTLHRQASGVTGRYEGELNNISVQQPTTDVVQMVAKKLAVIVPASNELLTDTSGRVNQMIVDDIGMGLSLREDLAFLRGDGTSNTPTGIRNQINAGNVKKYTTMAALLTGLRAIPRKANIPMRRLGWVFNSDVEALLYGALTDNGDYLYREEMDQGRLMGFPFRISNQIPSNLTYDAVTNGTEVYFGDWNEVMIGETLQLALDTSTEGSYFNGTTLVSAFSTDQTLFRARTRHDLGLRHAGAMAVGLVDITALAVK